LRYRGGSLCPSKTVAHPSTNRARRRATSLMETNALPMSHAATRRGHDCVDRSGHRPLPPRAHDHTVEPPPPCVSPLSRTLGGSVQVHRDLDRFRPPSASSALGGRFPGELAVNGMPPPPPAPAPQGGAGASLEPVSMTARRPLTGRSAVAAGHLPVTSTTTSKPHRAIKCYHCRMCEQVTDHVLSQCH